MTFSTIHPRRIIGSVAWAGVALAACSGGGGTSSTSTATGDSSGLPQVCAAQPTDAYASLTVQPSDTGTGISADAAGGHLVVVPSNTALRKNILMLFLGGTNSVPSSYTNLSDFSAAVDDFGTIDLSYQDTVPVATCLTATACYGNVHGEIVFGDNTAYSPGAPTYDSSLVSVSQANSVINRFVNLIDYLANPPASVTLPANFPPASYWTQFVTGDANSPYTTTHLGAVYPVWSKIIVAGHSQGAGNVAFLATHLPSGGPVRRAVLFSAPDDAVNADWIAQSSASLPMSRFWALRNANEGTYGTNVSANWAAIGGPGNGGIGGTSQATDFPVGAGDVNPQGQQRLLTDMPDDADPLSNHDSTAVDGACLPPLGVAWNYMFTGNSSD